MTDPTGPTPEGAYSASPNQPHHRLSKGLPGLARTGRLSGFVEETEIHGLRNAFHGRSLFRRGAWLTVFIISTMTMLYFLYNAFLEYTAGRLTTQTSLVVSNEIPFPAVAFCSINELDLVGYENVHIGTTIEMMNEFNVTDLDSYVAYCFDDEGLARVMNHPDVPELLKNFVRIGGCKLFQQSPALANFAHLYDQMKGGLQNLDKIMDVTLFPVEISKKAFETLASTYNTLAKAFPVPVPTTDDVKNAIGHTAGQVLNVVQDLGTNIVKAPGNIVDGIKRLGKRRRKRETFGSTIRKTRLRINTIKSSAYRKYTREMNKLTNSSTYPSHGLQHWRMKRSFIGDIENQITLIRDLSDLILNVTKEYVVGLLTTSVAFDQHGIITSCEWIDNEGAVMDCTKSVKPKFFVGFGKCYSVNEEIGEKRFKGDSFYSMIRVKLAKLPQRRKIFQGFFELPLDYSYRVYVSTPGISLPENEHKLTRVQEEDIHTFNVDNYKEVLMKSTGSTPCLKRDFYGMQYDQDTCIRDCFRLMVRKNLGCWLYDTEQYLMDRHKEEDVSDMYLCDTNATIYATEMRQNITECSRQCPLSCRYESFDIEHVRSKRRTDYVLRNTTHITASTEITVRQKRTTMQRQEQILAYTFFNLLAEVGGNMGLCIGASVLTICHLLEFVMFDLLAKGLSGVRSRGRSGSAVDAASKDSPIDKEISNEQRKIADKNMVDAIFPGPAETSKQHMLLKEDTKNRMRGGSRQSLDTDSYRMGVSSPIPSPLPRPEDIY